MHFPTIATTALVAFAGLASAGVQTRQSPGKPTCNPDQVICGAELRGKLELLHCIKLLLIRSDILKWPVSKLEDAIKAKGFTPNPARIDGIYRCVPDGIVWLAACFGEDGKTDAVGKCVPQFSQVPSNKDAYCRFGSKTPASK
ncbi:hypothetical protein ACHAQA_000053 [Verticillium albo-atrum]